jgi:hypothetical protein
MRLGTSLALDRLGALPVLPDIEALKAIGSCELIIDSIAGMSHNGVNVTALVDQSGNSRTITLTNAPLATATKWGGTLPAMEFVGASIHRLTVAALAGLLQPFSVVMVVDQLKRPAGADANIYRGVSGGAVGYLISVNPGAWSLYAGSVFSSASVNEGTANAKHIRTDVLSGASSFIGKGTSREACSVGTQGIIGNLSIGSFGAGSPVSMILAAMVIYSKALSAGEQNAIVTTLSARYPGIT